MDAEYQKVCGRLGATILESWGSSNKVSQIPLEKANIEQVDISLKSLQKEVDDKKKHIERIRHKCECAQHSLNRLTIVRNGLIDGMKNPRKRNAEHLSSFSRRYIACRRYMEGGLSSTELNTLKDIAQRKSEASNQLNDALRKDVKRKLDDVIESVNVITAATYFFSSIANSTLNSLKKVRVGVDDDNDDDDDDGQTNGKEKERKDHQGQNCNDTVASGIKFDESDSSDVDEEIEMERPPPPPMRAAPQKPGGSPKSGKVHHEVDGESPKSGDHEVDGESSKSGEDHHEQMIARAFKKISDEEQYILTNEQRGAEEVNYLMHAKAKVFVNRSMLKQFMPGKWLHDDVIDMYLYLLKDRQEREPSKFLKANFVPCGHNTMLSQHDRQGTKRYAKRVYKEGFFDSEKIFIPWNDASMQHWSLVVISIKDKRIEYYDSLYQIKDYSMIVMNIIASFFDLSAEMNGLKDIDMKSYEMVLVEKRPKQLNLCDCGMFVIKYADFIWRRLPLSFDQSDMLSMRDRTAYELLKLSAD